MIAYADGSEALPGDYVDLDGTPGIVTAVIVSPTERAHWGLDVPGVMVDTEAYGLMFEPLDSVVWDALVLLRRAAA